MAKVKYLRLTLLLPLLCGCKSSIPLEYVEFKDFKEPLETFNDDKGDIYYRNSGVQALEIDHVEGVNIKTGVYSYSSLNDVTTGYNSKNYSLLSNDIEHPNDYIEQKILVVPVYFTDSSVANDEQLQKDKKVLLENAFFGDSSTTVYQSVASFYNKSSYGHLRISGEVYDWIPVGHSSSDAYAQGRSSPENYSDKIADMIVNNLPEDIIAKYSNNNEGVIDSLYIIYDHPYQKDKSNSEDSLFWADAYHCEKNNKVSAYAWSSFYFLGNDVLETHRVDANTYIHETGHLFGLLDYYNRNSSSSYQPTGFMDVMDYNLGDHTPLSKYLLNWSSPYVLDMGEHSSGSITLKSFSSSGDFVLIPRSDYNGTPYDRYLLLSYFTPDGLNNSKEFPSYVYKDSTGKERIFTYPRKYGVLLYEVNAELAYYEYNSVRKLEPTCAVDQTPKAGEYVINFYHTNEMTRNNDLPLYHLLERSGNNTFMNGSSASDDTLFVLNSTFGVNTFTDLANEFGINFKVSKMNMSEVEITFNKL